MPPARARPEGLPLTHVGAKKSRARGPFLSRSSLGGMRQLEASERSGRHETKEEE